MSKLLGLLSVLAASALVAAQDSGTPIDFYTEVLYAPPSAWHSSLNDPCGAVDHYTTDPNAYLQVNFTGNKVVVNGMQNSASGVIKVAMDDQAPFTMDLYAVDVTCGTFFEYDVGNGTHTMTITLLDISPANMGDGNATQPVLHLMGIEYWTPDLNATTSSSVADLSSKHANVGAIVGGVVCSVVGAILLGGALFFFIRRHKRNQKRHVFDPSTVFVTELSTHKRTTSDVKLQPYAAMEDDPVDVKAGHLDVPPPSYALSTTLKGLRARSRSPNPDRKSSL